MNPAEIPPWSTVLSRHGVLFAPLCQFGGNLYGWTAYIQARDDQQADAEFCDHRWIKTLGLPYDRYRPLVEHIPGLVDDRLGRLARVELNDIAWSVSPRDQMLLREHDHTLNALAELLGVPIAALGIYGSTVYKSPGARSDFDFVIHGERHARSALATIRHLLTTHSPYQKVDGRVFHLRFRVPGLAGWFDPRFHTVDPFTAKLLAGGYQSLGVDDARTVTVTDDRDGLFNPAWYMLSDGSMLLSYRLGHAALFRTGDRLRLPALPCARFTDHLVRLVLRYEHIDFQRSTP